MSAKAIHMSLVANEVSKEVAHKLRTLISILSFDPQGFVRKFDNKGNMSLRKWHDSDSGDNRYVQINIGRDQDDNKNN